MTRKYIWWKSPEAALQHPKLIISKVMDIGDYHDVQKLAGFYGDEYLCVIVQTSEPGAFSPRSWAYWNYSPSTCPTCASIQPLKVFRAKSQTLSKPEQ